MGCFGRFSRGTKEYSTLHENGEDRATSFTIENIIFNINVLTQPHSTRRPHRGHGEDSSPPVADSSTAEARARWEMEQETVNEQTRAELKAEMQRRLFRADKARRRSRPKYVTTRWYDDHDLTSGEVLLDMFAGTAAVLIAGLLCGKKIARYYYCDNEPSSMARAIITMEWAMAKFPFQVDHHTFMCMFDMTDVRSITYEHIWDRYVTTATTGSPCHGYSRAQRDPRRRGRLHPETALIDNAVQVLKWTLEANPNAHYLFENVEGFTAFAEDLEWLRESLPGDDVVRDVATEQGTHRVRFWRTNLEGVDWDTPVGTQTLYDYGDGPRGAWGNPVREGVPWTYRCPRSWAECLEAADSLIAEHDVLAYEHGVLRTDKQRPILAERRETAIHGVVPVNTPGQPVLATACFMARGRDTWTMKPAGSEPGATGLGLVRILGKYDDNGMPKLEVPSVAAVGITMGVPPSLITAIMLEYRHGGLLERRGWDEEDYRHGLGNSMSIPAVMKFWRRKPPPVYETDGEESEGNGGSDDDAELDDSEPEPEGSDAESDEGSDEGSPTSGAGSAGGEGSSSAATELETGSEGSEESHGTRAAPRAEDVQDAETFLASLEDPPGPPEDKDYEERALEEHPDSVDLLNLGEDLMERLGVGREARGSGPAYLEVGEPFDPNKAPVPDPRDPQAPGPPDGKEIVSEVRRIIAALRAAQLDPSLATLGKDWTIAQMNAHLQQLMDNALDGTHFKALRYQEHVAAWEAMFVAMKDLGFQRQRLTKPQNRVLKILKNGYHLEFQRLEKLWTDGRPRAKAKYEAVRRLVRCTVGERRVDEFLAPQSSRPTPIHFTNHRTCEEHRDFLAKEKEVFLRSGAMRRWFDLPWSVHRGKPPLVVSPLSVAYAESRDKYRLCYDMRYVNLWLKYNSFKFETLEQLLQLIQIMETEEGDAYLCLSDMKSGYHHIPVHPECYTYCAVCLDNEYFYFPAMSFGMSSAVEVYCSVEGEKHRCLRHLGLKLVQYIDDRASPYSSPEQANFYEEKIIQLVTALGGYLSFGEVSFDDEGRLCFSKMQPGARKTGVFLGFLVDIPKKVVWIPEKKLAYFIKLCDKLLAKAATTPRDKAKFAGLVVSFMKALVPARLFVRRMFQALTGVIDWDAAYETPAEELAVIRRYKDNIRAWNGKRWVRSPVGFTLCGDASIHVGAAYEVLDRREKAPPPLADPFARPEEETLPVEHEVLAPEAEQQAPRPEGWMHDVLRHSLTDGRLKATIMVHIIPDIAARGSTVREVHVCRRAVQAVLEQHGKALRGSTIVYIADNLGMAQILNNWWAQDEHLCSELELMYDMLAEYGVSFRAHWEYRTTGSMQIADALGKEFAVDNSQWSLCNVETQRILSRYAPQLVSPQHPKGRRPTIDGMADPTNNKAELFISRELTPGCVGADFFRHLGLLSGRAPDGEKHLVWINGDFSRMADIVAAIWEYRIDAILIFPLWPAPWRDMLSLLPNKSREEWGPHELPHRPNLFRKGTQVATADTSRIRYPVASQLILWPEGQAGRRGVPGQGGEEKIE